MTTTAPPASGSHSPARLAAVDALRGLVMIVMALDHTRDFLHVGAMQFSADDLTRTTPLLFLTRWITHICAPVFVFTAGMGARLRLDRSGSDAGQVSRYLWSRGVWLILVELTVMRLAMNFTFDLRYPVLLIILWALGWSMIALAALVYLPPRAVGALGLGIIAFHNTFDGVQAQQLGALAWLWHVLHQPGAIAIGGVTAVTGYPVLPWIGVMATGFWAAEIYRWEPATRLRVLRLTGTACVAGFIVLRAFNLYGDPAPWSTQPTAVFTVLSFLNTTKYPPSLAFLLMTLGPACLLLAGLERASVGGRHPFVVFGRVPFAYYVVHFWLLHVAASAAAYGRYGPASLAYLWHPLPSMGGTREMFPADLGLSIGEVYLAWALLVAALYPLCVWLGRLKSRSRKWWLSYL
jgi:uncharacterized membrane protein